MERTFLILWLERHYTMLMQALAKASITLQDGNEASHPHPALEPIRAEAERLKSEIAALKEPTDER